MLTPNSLSHLTEVSAVHGAVSTYLAGPLVLPRASLRTAQKLGPVSNIHLHRHPPSTAATAVAHLPSGGRSSCTSHNCHPCSRIPPTPSVPPFYRSTRRLQPAVPASSVHRPLRCPLKTAFGQESRTGRRGCSQTGKPVQISSPPDGTKLPRRVFPFCISHTRRTRSVPLELSSGSPIRPAQPFPGTSVESPIRPRPRPRPRNNPRSTVRRDESVAPRLLCVPTFPPAPTRQTFVPPPLATTTLGLPLSDPSRPLPSSSNDKSLDDLRRRRLPMATAP